MTRDLFSPPPPPPAPRRDSPLPPNVRVGCSSFTADGWVGPFYPPGTPPADFLRHYSTRFDTVEVDATFYAAPALSTVKGWDAKTPPGFVLAAKVPQAITHVGELVGMGEDMRRFAGTMLEGLGGKLGPLVLQFAYVAKGKDAEEYRTGARFLSRLDAFLREKPPSVRLAVEIRNATWLTPTLLSLLREHGVALVASDYFTMPDLAKIERLGLDPLTADFAYVRFIGDRKKIEATMAATKPPDRSEKFDEIVVDRGPEMRRWTESLKRLATRAREIYVYFNNHYAGFGPGSVRLFEETWRGATTAPPAGLFMMSSGSQTPMSSGSQTPPERDAWEARYVAGDTRWDRGLAAPPFRALLASADAPRPGRLAAMGCGRGHDALLFARAGFEVVGFDFAPSAVRTANALAAVEELPAEFEERDVLALPGEHAGKFDYVLEHTCFCAIPPDRREDYLRAAAGLLKPGGRMIALFYPFEKTGTGQDGPDGGPPWLVREDDLRALFGRRFRFLRFEAPAVSFDSRQGRERLAVLELAGDPF